MSSSAKQERWGRFFSQWGHFVVDGAFAGGSVEAAVPRRMIEGGPSGLKRTRAVLEGHFNKIMATGAGGMDNDLQQSDLLSSQR